MKFMGLLLRWVDTRTGSLTPLLIIKRTWFEPDYCVLATTSGSSRQKLRTVLGWRPVDADQGTVARCTHWTAASSHHGFLGGSVPSSETRTGFAEGRPTLRVVGRSFNICWLSRIKCGARTLGSLSHRKSGICMHNLHFPSYREKPARAHHSGPLTGAQLVSFQPMPAGCAGAIGSSDHALPCLISNIVVMTRQWPFWPAPARAKRSFRIKADGVLAASPTRAIWNFVPSNSLSMVALAALVSGIASCLLMTNRPLLIADQSVRRL